MRSNHRASPNRIEEFASALLARSPDLEEGYKRPDGTTDILFPDDVHHASKDLWSDSSGREATRAKQRPAQQPDRRVRVHYGLIASGDTVVMSTQIRDEIMRRVDGDVLCFEIEAAGIASELPCMVIHGISDYADSHENNGWQYYAAADTAACAKELLSLAGLSRIEYAAEAREIEAADASVAAEQAFVSGGQERLLPPGPNRPNTRHRRDTKAPASITNLSS